MASSVLIETVAILVAANVAASGLAMRVPPRSAPKQILEPMGTLGGLVLGFIVWIVGVLLGIPLVRWLGLGVLAFATGATTFAAINRSRRR